MKSEYALMSFGLSLAFSLVKHGCEVITLGRERGGFKNFLQDYAE